MDDKKVTNKLAEISISAGSALVGFAVGGPIGQHRIYRKNIGFKRKTPDK